MPDMHFVTSSNIEAIGYDAETGSLHIRFLKSGKTYVYGNVPSFVFDELMRVDSKGTYFAREIKGRYEYYAL